MKTSIKMTYLSLWLDISIGEDATAGQPDLIVAVPVHCRGLDDL